MDIDLEFADSNVISYVHLSCLVVDRISSDRIENRRCHALDPARQRCRALLSSFG